MTAPTKRDLAFPGDLIEYTIGSTVITAQWLETGIYHVSVRQGPARVAELCQSFPDEIDARAFARGIAEMYRDLANGAPKDAAEIAPAIPEHIEPRTPLAAALVNLLHNSTVAKLAAELGVSRTAVYRWRNGSTPNPRNTAELLRLSKDLGDRGAGCGCRGYGRVQATTGAVATFLRCSCNPKAV